MGLDGGFDMGSEKKWEPLMMPGVLVFETSCCRVDIENVFPCICPLCASRLACLSDLPQVFHLPRFPCFTQLRGFHVLAPALPCGGAFLPPVSTAAQEPRSLRPPRPRTIPSEDSETLKPLGRMGVCFAKLAKAK